jgi:hypothetical protein
LIEEGIVGGWENEGVSEVHLDLYQIVAWMLQEIEIGLVWLMSLRAERLRCVMELLVGIGTSAEDVPAFEKCQYRLLDFGISYQYVLKSRNNEDRR